MDPVNQIRDLKDDEISVPLLDEDRSGLKKYKILKVTNRFEEHLADYSQDYVKIKELALKEKQIKTIKKWMSADCYDLHQFKTKILMIVSSVIIGENEYVIYSILVVPIAFQHFAPFLSNCLW